MADREEPEGAEMLTPAMQSAISAHEWYSALHAAGFRRHEALQIVIQMLIAGNQGAMDE